MPRLELDDFEVCGLLGEGGFGKVLIVEHKATSRVLALKFMRKEALVAAGPHSVEQALRERSIMARLSANPHPFVVRLHCAFQDEANVYLGIDYVGGGDLFGLIESCKRLPPAWAKFVGAEVCLALEHVHGCGILFRDLKPENVLVGMDGHFLLTDFGLAKMMPLADVQTPRHALRAASRCVGTPGYMAPEMLTGEAYGVGVDWWAFGCLVYELLTGFATFPDMQDMGDMMASILRGSYEQGPLEGIEHAGAAASRASFSRVAART